MEAVYYAGEVALTAKTNQSLMVTGIQLIRSAVDGVTISIDKDTVGYFLVREPRGNHLRGYAETVILGHNALSYMHKNNLFSGYPVAPGQSIKCDPPLTGKAKLVFRYDLYEAGDILPTAVNGTESDTYEYMTYGDAGAEITGPGTIKYINSLTPTSLIQFPFKVGVPANTGISVKAIFASGVGNTAAGPSSGFTDRLRLVRDRRVLYDQDRIGFAFRGNTIAAAATNIRGCELGWLADLTEHDPRPPYILDEAIDFSSGETLDVYVDFATDDTWINIDQDRTTIGFWQTVTKI